MKESLIRICTHLLQLTSPGTRIYTSLSILLGQLKTTAVLDRDYLDQVAELLLSVEAGIRTRMPSRDSETLHDLVVIDHAQTTFVSQCMSSH